MRQGPAAGGRPVGTGTPRSNGWLAVRRRRSRSSAFSVRRLLREVRTVWCALAPHPRDLLALGPLLFYRPTLAGLVLAACRRAGAEALLVDDRGPVSGTAVEDAVWTLAARIRAALLADPGQAPGSMGRSARPKIALHCEGHRGFVAAVAAAGVLGVDLLLLPPSTGALERSAILVRERLATVLTDAEVLVAFDSLDAARPDRTPRAAQLGRPPRTPRPARPGRLHLLTSGTTGTPSTTTRTGVAASQIPTVISLLAALGLRRGEPVLLAPPLAHGHGLSALTAALLTGAPPVLCAGAADDEVLDLARTHAATALLAVPTQLARLADHLREHPAADVPPLRRIAAGSGPLEADLAEEIMGRWGPVLLDFYGSSQAGTATIATARDLRAAPGTVGRAANGVQILVEEAGARPCPPGRTGRVRISSPWRAGNTVDGVVTGDIGHLDTCGRLFLHGRIDDVAVVGGHNVHLATVRDWFARQPGVRSARVRSRRDPEFGTVLTADLTGTGLQAPDLRRRARRELGDAATPRHISVSTSTRRSHR